MIVPLTYLGVSPLAFIGFVCPFIIFNLCNENWSLVPVQNDHEGKKVYVVARRGFILDSPQGKGEGEGTFNHGVVEQPVVRAIISKFESILAAADIEMSSKPCGQFASVEKGMVLGFLHE